MISRNVDLSNIRQENGIIHPDGFGAILCVSGSGRLTYGDMTYTMERHTLLVFTPYTVIHLVEGFGDMEGVLLEADAKTTLQLLADISVERRVAISHHPYVKISDEQERFILKLTDIMRHKEHDIDDAIDERIHSLLAQSLCLQILQVYSQSQKIEGTPVSHNDQIYNRFIEAVSANCRRERTVAFYASQQNLSVGHFSAIIRRVSGHSPMYWIELFTMTAIKKTLRESSRSVKEISDLMAFPDQSTFGRYFKAREGVSPQEYRISLSNVTIHKS